MSLRLLTLVLCLFSNSTIYAGNQLTEGSSDISSSESALLIEQIKQLRGELEQAQHDITSIKEDLKKEQTDNKLRFQKIDDDLQLNKKRESEKTDTISTENEIQDSYKEAYSLLKEQKYELASHKLTEFITKYSKNKLSASAYYWLGEINFNDKNYSQAAIDYMRGYKTDPKGSRAPDNLLKLAISLNHLQKRREACISLIKIQKNFPNASKVILQKTNEQIKKLNCS